MTSDLTQAKITSLSRYISLAVCSTRSTGLHGGFSGQNWNWTFEGWYVWNNISQLKQRAKIAIVQNISLISYSVGRFREQQNNYWPKCKRYFSGAVIHSSHWSVMYFFLFFLTNSYCFTNYFSGSNVCSAHRVLAIHARISLWGAVGQFEHLGACTGKKSYK